MTDLEEYANVTTNFIVVPCPKITSIIQRLIDDFGALGIYQKECVLRVIVNSIVLMNLNELRFSQLYDSLTGDVAQIRQNEKD